MTFEQVNQELPNGFHDGKIRGIRVDFLDCLILLAMDLHVGIPGDADPERYRPGTLRVKSPYLFFVDPPDPRYRFIPNGSPFNVDGDAVRPGQNQALDELLPVLPTGATAYRFFMEDCNSVLYIAGAAVEFSWDDADA